MKKIIPIVVVIILVFSSIGAVAFTENQSNEGNINKKSEMHTVSITPLKIEDYNTNYKELHLSDVSTYVMEPGCPMLPKVVKAVELDFGVKNIEVEVIPKSETVYEIDKEVRPAPAHYLLIDEQPTLANSAIRNSNVYDSSSIYPSTNNRFTVGCGLNAANERVTHLAIHLFPVRYQPAEGKLYIIDSADVIINYEESFINPTTENDENYDLVIIAPQKFSSMLQKLVDHKNEKGVKTYLKTTEEIYNEYTGVDKPEQIKYFIKDAIETYNIKYVLLIGGLKSLIWSSPRDNDNHGSQGWHVPVRYNNLFDDPEHPLAASDIFDPGVITDLYYSDIYEEGGLFSSWDPNGDGIFAAMSKPGVENDTNIDMYPDVNLGRLACRNIREVQIMVNKIIRYEKSPADPSWFKKMVVISGDGFLDQVDLDFQWDVNGLPDGMYTIYAQSKNPDDVYGPVDAINVRLDRTVESKITINHDDHLKVTGYPFPPIAEITSPSEGNILGNSDVFYVPTENEAYGNEFTGWANVSYEAGIMHIRGKSYDPRPYGDFTDIHVWVENSLQEVVFSDWRYDTEMYYEGEWITGERLLNGKGGALYYMPEDFQNEILWASNGLFTGQQDVIDSLNEGAGFVFFSGHGSPRVWADHFPGVPGNRQYGSVLGLITIDRFNGPPFLPMDRIMNIGKPFILVVGGCHNSQFNVSLVPSILDRWLPLYMWTYGYAAPECWSWWFTRLAQRGAIASIGNTGLGYGTLGGDCTIGGLDGGISLDFFRQYGEQGHQILGEAYTQTITHYLGIYDMAEDDHIKTVQQWVLLGDPSLMIGGYS